MNNRDPLWAFSRYTPLVLAVALAVYLIAMEVAK